MNRINIASYATAFLILPLTCIVACTVSSEPTENSANVSEVESTHELEECTDALLGETVFVTDDEAYYTCIRSKWLKMEANNEPSSSSKEESSDSKEESSSSKKQSSDSSDLKVEYGTLKDSELKVAANKVSVVAGSTVSAGATAEGQTITYASDDESIAVVAADGTITGVSAGTAVITVTAEANGVYKEATKTVTVVVTAKSTAKKSVVFKNTSKTYKAKTLKKSKKTFSVIKSSGGGKVTYKVTKGSKKYVSVSSKGVVTMKKGAKKASYKVKVTVAAKGNYKKTSKTISIKVK